MSASKSAEYVKQIKEKIPLLVQKTQKLEVEVRDLKASVASTNDLRAAVDGLERRLVEALKEKVLLEKELERVMPLLSATPLLTPSFTDTKLKVDELLRRDGADGVDNSILPLTSPICTVTLKGLQSELKALESAKQALEGEASCLRSTLGSVEAERDGALKAAEELKRSLEQALASQESAQAECASAKASMRSLESEFSKLHSEIIKSAERCAGLELELKELERLKLGLESELSGFRLPVSIPEGMKEIDATDTSNDMVRILSGMTITMYNVF